MLYAQGPLLEILCIVFHKKCSHPYANKNLQCFYGDYWKLLYPKAISGSCCNWMFILLTSKHSIMIKTPNVVLISTSGMEDPSLISWIIIYPGTSLGHTKKKIKDFGGFELIISVCACVFI